jgi:hypothetical protein
LANQARYLQQTPLTALEIMLEEHRRCTNDTLVEFVENLAAFVKQHISERLVLSAESSVNSSRRGSIGSSSSRRGSIDYSYSNTVGEGVVESDVSRLVDERESNYSPGAGGALSDEGEEDGQGQRGDISFRLRDPSDAAHTTGDSSDDEMDSEAKKAAQHALSPTADVVETATLVGNGDSAPSSPHNEQSESNQSTPNSQATQVGNTLNSVPQTPVGLPPSVSRSRSNSSANSSPRLEGIASSSSSSSVISSPSKENLLRSLNVRVVTTYSPGCY